MFCLGTAVSALLGIGLALRRDWPILTSVHQSDWYLARRDRVALGFLVVAYVPAAAWPFLGSRGQEPWATIGWVAAVVGVLYALHRLAAWMEARGWIYYHNKHGSSGMLGAAFLEVQSMFEPSKPHVLEVKQKEVVEDEESGDPPTVGEQQHQLD